MQHDLNINLMPLKTATSCSFKAKNKKYDYQKSLEKRAFIENETEPLNNLGFGLLVISLLLGTHNINLKSLKGKLSTSDKLGVGTFVLAFVSFIAASVKGIKLSKQYDIDNES